MNDILVLGGTGTTGRRVARRLTARGHRVRTAARTGGDHRLDLDDPAGWAPALDRVTALYLVEPELRPRTDRRERLPLLVDHAVAAGVRRLVLLSAHGVGEADDSHPLKAAERAVRDSGVDWTILRPGWFAQNFSETFWRPAVLAGVLAFPAGDGRTAFVDAEDIAEVAATALTEDGDRHAGQAYQLTGPRAIGFDEAAALIAAATGRALRHQDVTAEEFVAAATAHGTPAEAARRLAGLLTDIREGRGAEVSDGVERALGRPARSFEEHVTRAAAAGCWTPAV
ncbi:NAD(P)H-binding protein [Kitasatospora sp. NA04385]|uniref:NAD(P)H-binding protein n=1 Tax=Kitasatospora sp. NA04385 TaxID=2742135 RepID=UPI001590BCC0|nr:NAD(P)H-binding protein [Kitasatospora sp. NA04385]QKW23871.1 NAD(P)H-binding protein [Kitasatospora sp. NA04385]